MRGSGCYFISFKRFIRCRYSRIQGLQPPPRDIRYVKVHTSPLIHASSAMLEMTLPGGGGGGCGASGGAVSTGSTFSLVTAAAFPFAGCGWG